MSETAAADIPVVILCGGMGTRIRDVTDAVPKPLIDVGGRPILWHIMKTYDHFGFRRFILCLGYRSFDIKQYFLRYRENLADFTLHLKGDHDAVFRNEVGNEDWEVTCVETGLNTATGGRVGRVRQYVDTSTFMLTYGDGIGSVDISALLAAPSRAGPDRDRDGSASDVALRRDAGRRAGGRRVQREAERAGRVRQRRVLRLRGRVLRLPLGGRGPVPRTAAVARTRGGRAARGVRARRFLVRDGHVSRVHAAERPLESGRGAVEDMA